MMISVIVPVHKSTLQLQYLRAQINKEQGAELIFVVQDKAGFDCSSLAPNETCIFSKAKGRGNNFSMGIDKAQGDILLFNHADTILPDGWFERITETMLDKKNSGGGFHLQFDKQNVALRVLIWLSDCLFYITGEMWGDRSMFARTELIRKHKDVINVPIMEDVRLSRFLKTKGKVKLLKERVTTSCNSFDEEGIMRQVFKIIRCRTMFTVGKDLNDIYEIYYRNKTTRP